MFKEKMFNATLAGELSQIPDVRTKSAGMEQAFAELYQILKHCNQEVMSYIPEKFLQMLQKYMDTDWRGSLDFTKRLADMNMLDETRVLLHLVHRDFLCYETERKELIEMKMMEAESRGEIYPLESLYDLMELLN